MAITTLRPSSTVQGGLWTGQGGTSSLFWSLLSDDDDNTYVRALETINSNQAELQLGLQDLGISSDLPIRAVRTRVKARAVTTGQPPNTLVVKVGMLHPGSVNSRFDEFLVPIHTTGTYTGPWYQSTPNGHSYTHDMINDMVQTMRSTGASSQNELNVLETYLDVEYFDPPSATIVSPTGTIAVTSPTIDWDFNSPDYHEQLGYEAEILEGSTVIWSSGVVKSRVTQVLNLNIHLFNGNYTLRLRVKSNWGGSAELWSDWEEEAFTVNAPVAAIPTISVSLLAEEGVLVKIQDNSTTPAAEEFILERTYEDQDWEELAVIPLSGMIEYMDIEMRPLEDTYYRARSVRYVDSDRLVSGASNVVTTVYEPSEWYLKDYDTGEVLQLDVEQDSLDIEWGEDQAVMNPLGNVREGRKVGYTVVKGAMRGDKFPVTAGMLGDEDYKLFKKFRAAQKTLLLVAPMIDGFWYIVFGNSIRNKVLNLNDPIYRQITFDVLEVERVPDQ